MSNDASASFNFCHSAPPEEFYKTIQSINRLSAKQYTELFENIFVLINQPDLTSEIDALLNLCSERTDLDIVEVKSIMKVLLIICKEARRNKLTTGQLYSDMLKLKMNAPCATSFCQSWKQNVLLPKQVSEAVSSKRLIDIDWKFGVTASNDSLARVGNCYLQLKMVVANGANTESILMEMSIPQFYEFMHEIEKAKLELDSLS